MNKLTLSLTISFGLLCVIVALFIAYKVFYTPTSQPGTTSSGPFNSAPTDTPNTSPGTPAPISAVNATDERFDLSTSNGQIVRAKNFLTSPATVQDSTTPDYYYLGYHFIQSSSSTPAITPPYIIEYIRSTQFFDIVIFQ